LRARLGTLQDFDDLRFDEKVSTALPPGCAGSTMDAVGVLSVETFFGIHGGCDLRRKAFEGDGFVEAFVPCRVENAGYADQLSEKTKMGNCLPFHRKSTLACMLQAERRSSTTAER
jgi:hypothetical protein